MENDITENFNEALENTKVEGGNIGGENENQDYIKNFKEEFSNENDSENGSSEEINESVKGVSFGISIPDLLKLLPQDTVQDLLNAPEYLAYRAYSKDLDAVTKKEVKPFFKASNELNKLREEVLKILVKKYFPNWDGITVPPELVLAIATIHSVKSCINEAKGFTAEKNYLNDKKDKK